MSNILFAMITFVDVMDASLLGKEEFRHNNVLTHTNSRRLKVTVLSFPLPVSCPKTHQFITYGNRDKHL